MPTTAKFDTLFSSEWTGEVTATVMDPDGTPNRVLDPDQPWNIKVRWSLYTDDPATAPVNVLAGHWRIEAYVEAIGTAAGAYEGPLLPAPGYLNVPYTPPLPGGTASEYKWESILPIAAGRITEPGIYKITLMIQYHTALNALTSMVGFAEYPAICFSRL